MKQNVEIILASGSPRRKELLEKLGLNFQVVKSDAEEVITETIPENIVKELSLLKGRDVLSKLHSMEKNDEIVKSKDNSKDKLIVSADTIVCIDGKVLGKPENEDIAVKMLMNLSGRNHSVFTGVTGILLDAKGEVKDEFSFAEETKVFMYPFSEAEAKAYVNTKEPMDKAGAYGIQGIGGIFVEKIEGDYNNVVGFPLSSFIRLSCQRGYFEL